MYWMDFKEWFLLQGSIMTMWALYGLSVLLAISCHWPRHAREKKIVRKHDGKEFRYIRQDIGKEARKGLAYIFAFCATAMLIYSVFPFNFEVLYRLGGLGK